MHSRSPRWEYQVVRLNIDPGGPPSSQVAAPKDQQHDFGQSDSQQPFSDTYLKQEFPNFYQPSDAELRAAQIAAQQADPAFQLQHFLNAQGEDGWECIGIDRAGPHEFVLFKRLLPSPTVDRVDPSDEQLRLTLELASKCLSLMDRQQSKSAD